MNWALILAVKINIYFLIQKKSRLKQAISSAADEWTRSKNFLMKFAISAVYLSIAFNNEGVKKPIVAAGIADESEAYSL